MPQFTVEVGVALSRPPRTDRTLHFRLDAPNGDAAELMAQQWAASHPGVVMPVSSVVTDWSD